MKRETTTSRKFIITYFKNRRVRTSEDSKSLLRLQMMHSLIMHCILSPWFTRKSPTLLFIIPIKWFFSQHA